MSRAKKTPFKSWESTKENGIESRYIREANSQMVHPAMLSLNHAAFHLYLYMKLESGGNRKFNMPFSKYKRILSKQGFQRAVQELCDKGFIKVLERNANVRLPNVYEFSDAWKHYNEP